MKIFVVVMLLFSAVIVGAQSDAPMTYSAFDSPVVMDSPSSTISLSLTGYYQGINTNPNLVAVNGNINFILLGTLTNTGRREACVGTFSMGAWLDNIPYAPLQLVDMNDGYLGAAEGHCVPARQTVDTFALFEFAPAWTLFEAGYIDQRRIVLPLSAGWGGPANCADAIALGLTSQEAAQYSNLDRDGDGVACEAGASTGGTGTASGTDTGTGAPAPSSAPAAGARPANCAQAVEWGLTPQEAAQWSHLDRDGDGEACYGT
ncbi:MAG: excalibur calcium-binding domain-containing protein [Aggregatilineales bacterium]